MQAIAYQLRESNTNRRMKMKKTFLDWAGEAIPFRVYAQEDAEPHERFVCDISPHGEWVSFGRGRNAALALQRAISDWNDYDQSVWAPCTSQLADPPANPNLKES